MSQNPVVVLSDVHIGNNTSTCWYQSRVHDPYLVAALRWIVENAGSIREVILLGDLVDLWTYPPSVRPPSMQEIIDANPAIFGRDGALAEVVRAVPRVSFMLGNHDGTLGEEDIAALRRAVGPITLVDPVYVLTGASGARTVFSHGHHWTMFNAPDPASPWGSLPIGHFVTRALSYRMVERLESGQTVADVPKWGTPETPELIVRFLQGFNPRKQDQLGPLFLDGWREVAGMPADMPIHLPSGLGTTTMAQARTAYPYLFARWLERERGVLIDAVRTGLADVDGKFLAWFAQRLAIEHSADLVVFGHTHVPVYGLIASPIAYFNSGFECVPTPDNPPEAFTFTVVDLDEPQAQIMTVDRATCLVRGMFGQRMLSAVAKGSDYSCYVRILNEGPEPLTRVDLQATLGTWVVPPPQEIPANGRGDGWLEDKRLSPAGSQGAIAYRTPGGRTLHFTFQCPTARFNRVSGPGNRFRTRVGAGDWGRQGEVKRVGEPLQVIFTC